MLLIPANLNKGTQIEQKIFMRNSTNKNSTGSKIVLNNIHLLFQIIELMILNFESTKTSYL